MSMRIAKFVGFLCIMLFLGHASSAFAQVPNGHARRVEAQHKVRPVPKKLYSPEDKKNKKEQSKEDGAPASVKLHDSKPVMDNPRSHEPMIGHRPGIDDKIKKKDTGKRRKNRSDNALKPLEPSPVKVAYAEKKACKIDRLACRQDCKAAKKVCSGGKSCASEFKQCRKECGMKFDCHG